MRTLKNLTDAEKVDLAAKLTKTAMTAVGNVPTGNTLSQKADTAVSVTWAVFGTFLRHIESGQEPPVLPQSPKNFQP